MGIFRLRRPPVWAKQLLLEMAQVNQQLGKLVSEDAAVEADVAEINADVTALAALIASLQSVNVGDTITPQTKADLDAAVAALGNLVPPAAPPATP